LDHSVGADQFFIGDENLAKQQIQATTDAEHAREVMDKVQRGRAATSGERAEFRRISGSFSVLGSTLQAAYATANIPLAVPSISMAQATDLIMRS
jgi:hypothetical protein